MVKHQMLLLLAGAFLTSALMEAGIQSFGVGFDLGMTYGCAEYFALNRRHLTYECSVASVAFPNGTLIDIAKVQGGPVYQQSMLEGYDSTLGVGRASVQELKTGGAVQSLLGLLSPWSRISRPHLTTSVLPMIETLRMATENYLGFEIKNATYTTPYPISEADHELLGTTIPGLFLYTNPHRLAASLAIRAYGIDIDMSDHGEQIMLAVEMSQAALTASIILEDQGVIDLLRLWHVSTLGHDSVRGMLSSKEELETRLKRILTTPVHYESRVLEPRKLLQKLILFGEVSVDSPVTQALRCILGEKRYNDAVHYSVPNGYGVADPTYAASRGAAMDCVTRLTKCDSLQCWSNSYLDSDTIGPI